MVEAKVTVLVPVYNVERYIAKCLDSLLEQTFDNFEVWAVSDGSPDNSVDIIKKYCQKDNRIKLIEKENGGYGSVLQYGVQNIKSKYFIICDPDDWLAPTAIEELYVYAEENNLDITVGDRYNVYDNGSGEYNYTKVSVAGHVDIEAQKVYSNKLKIQQFSFASVTPHAKLYRTKIARGIVFPERVSYTDFVLYMISLANAEQVAYYSKPLAYYLVERKGNSRTDIRPQIVSDYLTGWYAVINQLEEKNIKNYPVLLSRLLRQIKEILQEYKRTNNMSFNDKYGNEIIKAERYLSKYKHVIWKDRDVKMKTKVINGMLLNSLVCKLGSQIYLKYV